MIKKLTYAYVSLFVVTGALVLYIDAFPGTDISAAITPLKTLIFGSHMAVWMILGMISNYLWDLFKEGKNVGDIHLPDLFLPILVSPIVFFGIWSMWPNKEISFALNLIAFQNGFFWQVILSKSGPVTQRA